MMKALAVSVVMSLVALSVLPPLAGGVSQIAPKDGLWLSLPPDMIKCILVRLPEDAGITRPGNYIFSVGVEPGPQETWADLSEQIVREVHENNTVEIPICFDKHVDKPMGNCSAPYTITVREEYTGIEKSWRGGVCVSSRADVDILPPGSGPMSGDDVRDILNENTDIFSAWLEEGTLHAMPGETATFNLSVQSNENLDIAVLTQSDLEVSPASESLSTSQGSPYHYREFDVAAPDTPGTYTVSMRVSPEDCQGKSFCTKFLEATLVVSQDSPPPETGFRVSLDPENIDVKKPEAVSLRLIIENNEPERRTFTSSVSADPSDLSIGFTGETVSVGPYEMKSRSFILTPGGSSSLYEVTARVKTGNFTLSATSFITIDEMLTDALRMSEGLGQDASSDVSDWRESHLSSGGSGLDEYGSLIESLKKEGSGTESPPPVPDQGYVPPAEPRAEPMDFSWIIAIAVIGAGVGVAAYLFLRKTREGGEEPGDATYY